MLVSLEAYQRNLAISSKQQVSPPLCIYSFDEGKMRHYLLSNFYICWHVEIQLYQNSLTGSLPSELGLLDGLVYLYLGSWTLLYRNNFIICQLSLTPNIAIRFKWAYGWYTRRMGRYEKPRTAIFIRQQPYRRNTAHNTWHGASPVLSRKW